MKLHMAILLLAAASPTPSVANSWTADDVWSTGALSVGHAPLIKIDAVFPPPAREKNASGWLAYRFEIDASGQVRNPQVVSSSRQDLFGPASLAALARWSYSPSEEPDRTGCALFLFQSAAAPINVSELASSVGAKLDCGRESLHMLVPSSLVLP